MELRCTSRAFLITTLLYGIIAAIVFWQVSSNTIFAEKKQKVREIPINIAMFQAPAPPAPTPPPVVPPPPKKVEPPKPKPPKKVVKKKKVKKKPVKKKLVKRKPIPKPKPVPKPPEPEVVEEVVEEVEEVIETPVTEVVEVVEPTPPPPPPMYSASQVADAEDRYLSELNRTLAKLAKDAYPRRAKRRRWEGEVMLRFVLQKDGRITELEIIEENRRQVLNKAALSIIEEKMKMRFKAFYEEIDRDQWALNVPVNFTFRN